MTESVSNLASQSANALDGPDDLDGLDGLELCLAKQACHDLVMRFAACNDHRDPKGLGALFAEQGVLVRPGGDTLVGPAAIAEAYAARPADRITRHLVGNVLIDVISPMQARGSSMVLLWSASAQDGPGPFGRAVHGRQVMGEFEDTFVRTAQGWRIARREARFTFVREA